jgi:hypothetical protein
MKPIVMSQLAKSIEEARGKTSTPGKNPDVQDYLSRKSGNYPVKRD